jgi:hypothetical protein
MPKYRVEMEPYVLCICGANCTLEELKHGYDLGFNERGDTATFTCPDCGRNATAQIYLRIKD